MQNHILQGLFRTITNYLSKPQPRTTESTPIFDWDNYSELVDIIRTYGCTNRVNFAATPTNATLVEGKVTQLGLIYLLEDLGFTGGLSSTLRDNLLVVFADRTLVHSLPSGESILFHYSEVAAKNYAVKLSYCPDKDGRMTDNTIGNKATQFHATDIVDKELTLADILLKGIDASVGADPIPSKYNDILAMLVSVTNCFVGAKDKFAYQLISLDRNSTKSSTPTMYATFSLLRKPGSFYLHGIHELNIGEEFGRYMVSQPYAVEKHTIHATGGYLRVINNDTMYDIRVGIEEDIDTGVIQLDFKITKRRNKVYDAN